MSALVMLVSILPAGMSAGAQEAQESEPIQTAIISEDIGYINLSDRGGAPGGDGVDNDGPPPLQQAGLTASFDNFALNGISFDDWQACRGYDPETGEYANTVDQCLIMEIGDRDGDGFISLRDLHPGTIGGDTLTFDITITNTSPDGGPVLTTFAFQSKFSESPALGSRIGDKLFSAECVPDPDPANPGCDLDTTAAHPLIGVKKNGTANGLYGGKIKGICINSSDDYPSILNLGTENETLECAGGRTFDFETNRPILQAADGDFITPDNIELPKGLLPGESVTMRLVLDAGTDDGALQRAYSSDCDDLSGDEETLCKAAVGPLVGTLANIGEFRDPDKASECLKLDVQTDDNVVEVVNFGDVKIIRDSAGKCAPSFYPFSKNQLLTIPRRNWAFTDILDTRDDYLAHELPTVLTGDDGKFSFLDFDNLRPGEMNFFEILRGFGEFDDPNTEINELDPSCLEGGSREGACGGDPYVAWGEFYALVDGNLVRQEVAGGYGPADYTNDPADPTDGARLTATVDTGDQTDCRPDRPVRCKTTDPFEPAGEPNPGSKIGASAVATFSDVVVISDDKTTIANEGGQAAGDRVRFTLNIENTSPAGSDIYLTSFNFQTKSRGLTDINVLDGTTILGRQDLRAGPANPAIGFNECGDDPLEAACFDTDLQIGRFPNVIGNSLLSSTFAEPDPLDPLYGSPDQAVVGKLEAIKKNGTFQPLLKSDFGAANFVCIKSGPPAEEQDADETCSGEAGSGLLPGESQSVRLEMDYGDFRGLILRVKPKTLIDYEGDVTFGLLGQGGDFDCKDQRRLPFCHPDLIDDGLWFTSPTTLEAVEFVTVHQAGEAATVMNFTENFGKILAMAGFVPTAEFYQGDTQMQVMGEYLNLPGVDEASIEVSITDPADGSTVAGTIDIVASAVGTVTVNEVEFFVNGSSLGVDADASDGWSKPWDTTGGLDGDYVLTAVARAFDGDGNLVATAESSPVTVTVANALVVEITQPADGSTVTGLIDVVAETTGLNPATGVTFSYAPANDPDNSTGIGAATETSPGVWEISWDTSTLTGDYSLTATATNAEETATDTIAVEVVTLAITIVTPDDGAVLSGIVEVQAEVVSATEVDSVEFFYQAAGAAASTSLGTAVFDSELGLWVLEGGWDTRGVEDTPLTKPVTHDALSAVVKASGSTASDVNGVRIANMLTPRIFLPDNTESLIGYQDLEALVTSEFDITGVRYDLYDISDIDPDILVPFGEASENGEPIENPHYSTPTHNPGWPTGSPVHEIGEASFEGAQRWVLRDWDTKTVPDGTYGLVATATDAEGRTSTYTVVSFIVNDFTVDITTPTSGDTVTRFVALEAFTGGLFPATDVVFSVGGSDIVAEETFPGSGRWRATWETVDSDGNSLFDDGDYTITATATSLAAEVATDSVDVILDKGTDDDLAAFFPFDWSNCIQFDCAFLDGSSGGPTSWLWDFGDGNTSTAQNPTHSYDTYGVYRVTLTVGDGTDTDTYWRDIAVGNIGIDDFNSQVVSGDETIAWTSALKDFGYTVGETIAVPVMWKTSVGTGEFRDMQRAILFTPDEADGEVDEEFFPVEDGVLFTMRFTEVQFKGETEVFKGKVNLGLNVNVDLNDDGTPDEVATLGTNVDVTNTDLIDEGDSLHVWVTEPDEGDQVSGVVPIAATPLSTLPVEEVEFFVDGESIGLGSPDPDSGRWLIDWDTTGLADGDYALTAVAHAGSLVASSTPVTVTLNNSGEPLPTVTLTADKETVTEGDSSTLNWSSTDATSCEADWTDSTDTSGSEVVTPTETTTYTMTCSGPGGTAEDSVTVTVEPAPDEGPTFTGSSTDQGRFWSAIVTVSNASANTLIEGSWDIGGEEHSCTTDDTGSCTITRSGIPKTTRSATWTYTATGEEVTISKPE